MADTQEVVEDVAQQDEEQQTESQREAEESAAFESSFGNARSEELPAEPEDVSEQDPGEVADSEVDETAQVDDKATEQNDQPAILFAGMTEQQLTEALAKIPQLEQASQAETRKLHGKLGELNRTLQDLQKNGNRSSVKVAKEQFKRLSEDYPDLAELLAEDLSGFDLSGNGVSEDHINPIVERRVSESVTAIRSDLEREMNANLLKIQHGADFQSQLYQQETVIRDGKSYVQPKRDEHGNLVRQPDFAVWLQTQPETERSKIEEAWDPVYLSGKLTEFKDWRNKKQQGTQQRQDRLRNAITPRTTQAAEKTAAMTEEDGFKAAFKK